MAELVAEGLTNQAIASGQRLEMVAAPARCAAAAPAPITPLYAEQISRAGQQQGNFPRSLTHLALISAAFNLDRAVSA